MSDSISYLKQQLINHISLCFNLDGKELLESRLIRFDCLENALNSTERTIFIPTDVPFNEAYDDIYHAEFNQTTLTLWNRLNLSAYDNWRPISDESAPLWYQNSSGTLISAWNLFGNLMHTLTFAEEKSHPQKDSHGRYTAAFGPRLKKNLLEVPVFNDAAAVLVAGCSGLKDGNDPLYEIKDLVKPPYLALSHDCDLLRGNDKWTQAVRAYRTIIPLKKLKFPAMKNLWWIVRNCYAPERYYFDNITGLIELEKSFGYISTFYLINGQGGRFGARSSNDMIKKLVRTVPSDWALGIHYNYNTFLNEKNFIKQYAELSSLTESNLICGRAHYLKFDPFRSFQFLAERGIKIDESSGYTDKIGYRNGIAGAFQPYKSQREITQPIWELPMTIMDAALVKQYGDQAVNRFDQLMNHLSKVGGMMSINFHPDKFFNPEYKELNGIYHKMLITARQYNAKAITGPLLLDYLQPV